MERKIKLVIEYNGAKFHGWQVQNNLRTVQGTLEKCLEKMLGCKTRVTGASRTDAGVHALGQVAHFVTCKNIPAINICRGLNGLTPYDISILHAEETSLDFHARYSSKNKVYIYKIFCREYPSPFFTDLAWQVPYQLDINSMEEASKHLFGEHDFSAFRSSSCSARTPIRKINYIQFDQDEFFLGITVDGSGFLQHMVRTIVGTLVDVGKRKLKPHDLNLILESKNRNNASKTAPAAGLYLVRIMY